MNTTILLATLTLLCAVAAVPVPELPAQSIDLVKIPLNGDKVGDTLKSYKLLPIVNIFKLFYVYRFADTDWSIGVNLINRCLLCLVR